MAAGKLESAAAKDAATGGMFELIFASKGTKEAKNFACNTKTGRWLNALPISVSGCCLNKQELRYAFYDQYACLPHDLPTKCDRCGAPFSMAHAFLCKSGGLIIARHNEVCREIIHHAVQALSPSSIQGNHLSSKTVE